MYIQDSPELGYFNVEISEPITTAPPDTRRFDITDTGDLQDLGIGLSGVVVALGLATAIALVRNRRSQ